MASRRAALNKENFKLRQQIQDIANKISNSKEGNIAHGEMLADEELLMEENEALRQEIQCLNRENKQLNECSDLHKKSSVQSERLRKEKDKLTQQIKDLKEQISFKKKLKDGHDGLLADEMLLLGKNEELRQEVELLSRGNTELNGCSNLQKETKDRLEVLNNENYKLEQHIRDLREQISTRKSSYAELEDQDKLLRGKNDNLLQEIEHLNKEFEDLNDRKDAYRKIIKGFDTLRKSNEEMEQLFQDLTEQISTRKSNYAELEDKDKLMRGKNESLQQEIQHLKREFEELNDRKGVYKKIIKDLDIQRKSNEEMEQRIQDLKEQISTRKNSHAELEDEEKLLRDKSESLQQEIQHLISEAAELNVRSDEHMIKPMDILRKGNDTMEQHIQELREQISNSKHSYAGLEAEEKLLRGKNDNLQQEIQHLNRKAEELNDGSDVHKKIIERLDILKKSNDLMEQRIHDLTEQISNSKHNYAGLEAEEKLLRGKNDNLQQEIQHLNRKVEELNDSSDVHKKIIERLDILKKSNDEMEQRIHDLTEQMSNNKHNYAGLEAEEKLLRGKNDNLQQEIQHLNREFEKLNDGSDVHKKIVKRLDILRKSNEEMEQRFQDLTEQISTRKNSYAGLEDEEKLLRGKNDNLRQEIQHLRREVAELNVHSDEAMKQHIDILREGNDTMEQHIQHLRVQIFNSKHSYAGLEAKEKLLSSKNDNLWQEIQHLRREANELNVRSGQDKEDKNFTDNQLESILATEWYINALRDKNSSMNYKENNLERSEPQRSSSVEENETRQPRSSSRKSQVSLNRLKCLEKENVALMDKIQYLEELNSIGKNFNDKLPAEEEARMLKQASLTERYAKALQEFESLKCDAYNYDQLKKETHSLQHQYDQLTGAIDTMKENMFVAQVEYKTLKREKALLEKKNTTLLKKLHSADNLIFKQKILKDKADALQKVNSALIEKNNCLENRVRELNSSLCDEQQLADTLKALKVEQDALQKENTRLQNLVEEAEDLNRKGTPMGDKKENPKKGNIFTSVIRVFRSAKEE